MRQTKLVTDYAHGATSAVSSAVMRVLSVSPRETLPGIDVRVVPPSPGPARRMTYDPAEKPLRLPVCRVR